jgi:hypothetical protein
MNDPKKQQSVFTPEMRAATIDLILEAERRLLRSLSSDEELVERMLRVLNLKKSTIAGL